MYDIIVIGGGASGVSAALYAISRGKKVLVIEKEQIGGMIRTVSNVTHYSGLVGNETGLSFSSRLEEQLNNANALVIYEEVIRTEFSVERKVVYTNKNIYEADKIIIANGSTPRRLGVEGESLNGVYYNTLNADLLAANKTVYVVGGSDGAIKEALYLSNYAKEVNIVHFEDSLQCIYEFKSQLAQKININLCLNSRIEAIKGDSKIESIDIYNEKTYNTKTISDSNILVYVYAGSVPNTDLYLDLQLENGYIVSNDKMETNIPGVYACGDIRVKQVRQLVTAVSDGAIAAINACK